MPTNRRDFLKASAAIAAVTGARAAFGQPAGAAYLPQPSSDTAIDDLALEALNAAQAAGATYADARIGRYRRQFVATREHNVTGVADSESYGIGVRALAGGSWGFASTNVMTKDGITKVAQEAVRLAKA
ncbi:MAG: DNA gyrase modulator, partial [Gemmatimonadales bacterium]